MLQAAPPPKGDDRPRSNGALALIGIAAIAVGSIGSIYLLDWRWAAIGFVVAVCSAGASGFVRGRR